MELRLPEVEWWEAWEPSWEERELTVGREALNDAFLMMNVGLVGLFDLFKCYIGMWILICERWIGMNKEELVNEVSIKA